MISRNLMSLAAVAALLAGPALAAQEPASPRAEPAAAAPSGVKAQTPVTTMHKTRVRHVRRAHRKAHGRTAVAARTVVEKHSATVAPATTPDAR